MPFGKTNFQYPIKSNPIKYLERDQTTKTINQLQVKITILKSSHVNVYFCLYFAVI